MAIQGFLDVVFGTVANKLLYYLAIFENKQGRNASDLVSHWRSAVAVNIHFADFDFALVLAG
jgi:hypothetical protein